MGEGRPAASLGLWLPAGHWKMDAYARRAISVVNQSKGRRGQGQGQGPGSRRLQLTQCLAPRGPGSACAGGLSLVWKVAVCVPSHWPLCLLPPVLGKPHAPPLLALVVPGKTLAVRPNLKPEEAAPQGALETKEDSPREEKVARWPRNPCFSGLQGPLDPRKATQLAGSLEPLIERRT